LSTIDAAVHHVRMEIPRGLGVVTPYDFALDHELWRWAPEGVSLHAARTAYAPLNVTMEMVEIIGEPLSVAHRAIDLTIAEPEVVAYACTSGSFVGGVEGERAITDSIVQAGLRGAVTTSGAFVRALHHLGVDTVAVATPYDEEITDAFVAFLREAGFTVAGSAFLGLDHEIFRVPYDTTKDLIRRAAATSEVEAVVVSCTNLPTYDIIGPLEEELGIPVLTANQVTMWSALAEMGLEPVGPGQRLLSGQPVPRPSSFATVSEPLEHEEAWVHGGLDHTDLENPWEDVEIPDSTPLVGREPPHAFPTSEYYQRVERVQQRMRERELDALVVTDPANLYYLSGYNAWSFYMPQCIVVPAYGQPHLFTRAMDANGAQHSSYFEAERIHGYPEHLIQRPDVHPYHWITETAVGVGVLPDRHGARVAAELDAYYFSPRGYEAMRERLEAASIEDAAELVNWVRAVKSPREQEKLRIAGTIAERVMTIAIEQIEAGRRQCDVVAEIQHAQALGARGLGGDYPAIVPMLPTGETAGTPHLTWSDLPLVHGEATTIEIAGVHHRYHAPLARTVSLGKPPRRLNACAEAVAEGLEGAMQAMRPGATGRDVHTAFTHAINRYGLHKESRIGYSIGIGYPPDWGERTVSLRSEEETPIEAGMAFHLILGMWMDGWGYETSESLLVTPDGVERLADVPQGLVVKT
jgi:ectoine hydrolase